MKADDLSDTVEFAQFACEMDPNTKSRVNIFCVNSMRYELNYKITEDKVLWYDTGSSYDFRYAITSKHSRRQLNAFFERTGI